MLSAARTNAARMSKMSRLVGSSILTDALGNFPSLP